MKIVKKEINSITDDELLNLIDSIVQGNIPLLATLDKMDDATNLKAVIALLRIRIEID